MSIGSRGDVAPYVGLGLRLQAAGHDVIIATQEAFADFVRERGLGYRPLAGDIREDLLSPAGSQWQETGTGWSSLNNTLRLAFELRSKLGDGVIAAAEGADVLMLQRMVNLHGFLAAKAMGIHGMTLELFPTPSWPVGDFPPVATNLPDWGPAANRMFHRLMLQVGHSLGPMVSSWLPGYLRDLGLPQVSYRTISRAMLDESWPIMHGYSPAFLPRPSAWPARTDVTGYWWLDRPADWQPPSELVDFLNAGPAPVFVGFGSMLPNEGEELSRVVLDAARQAGVRLVVQAGWSGLSGHGDDVLTVGDVPHEWLFPQMAAVVQHGGAGTTGAVVRAGVPAVTTPVLADQPFWGEQLVRAGVSPGTASLRTLTTDTLASLLREAVTRSDYRRNAEVLSSQVRAEDGAQGVLDALDRLPASGQSR